MTNQIPRPKRLAKKIGIGALIIVPLVVVLSILFADLKMNSALSIFLTVLACGIVCFVYVIIYTKIEDAQTKKWEGKSDPFNRE